MTSRLKSLELHGYKTFASRTLFEFPGSITAVVGPNGSGKSNIADAVRWVLGEQSYSLLRGRKTEDMIFAGSEQRPRAGMASATIVFDNSDGWLPIDYSEVSVTRRAYRDGQNEYVLNGQKVRLKEISELLAQSGLAERTYTIIGQGLVDAALSLRPDERRRFFEEAAGIGLYRSRREEAINRLDTTRRNLERVLDILSELEPRLASLEKQARRAIEYERIKADLRLLLREWYGYHWHQTQREFTHEREVLKVQEVRQLQARQKLEESETLLADERTQLLAVRGQLNEWHTQSANLHQQREKISRELAVLDERLRSITEQQRSMQTDLASNEDEHAARRTRLESLTGDYEHLKLDVQEAQQQVDEARRTLQKRQIEREQIEQKMREARKSLLTAETRQVQVRAHLNELNSRQENLQRSRESAEKSLKQEAGSFTSAEEKLKQAEKSRVEAEAQMHTLEEQLTSQRERLAELDARRRQLTDSRSRLETERSKIRAQADVLDQAEKSFSGLNQGARFLLQAAKQGKLPASLRALNNNLEVPAQYEIAIAAVLGEYLDAVVLEPSEDSEPVLKMLEGGEKGRAVLVPLALLGNDVMESPQDEDCLGVAARLVQPNSASRLLVDSLLGQVVIVRSRAAARRIVSQLPRQARAVTLQGEIFWGNGVIIAGQDGRAGVIGRTRQKRELEESLEKLNQDLQILGRQIKTVEEETTQLTSQRQALEAQLKQVGQRSAQLAQAYQQARLAVDQAQQRQEYQRNQLTSLEKQTERTTQEVQASQKDLEVIAAQITSFNDQVRQHSRTLNGMPLEELQSQLAHWTTNAAVAGRALKDAESRLEEQKQLMESGERNLAALNQRIQSATLLLGQFEEQKSSQRTTEGALNQQIETLQQQIDPAELELTRQEEEYNRQQTNHTAVQQMVSATDRGVIQVQMEVGRIREALESLRRRVEDDFGLVSFESASESATPTPLPLEGMVQQLPRVTELAPEIEESINRQRAQIRRMGAVNPDAAKEYQEVKQRYEFLTQQVDDLKKADIDLREVITELDELMKREFRKTFDAVAIEFKQMFTRLFGGGSARLVLVDEDHPTEAGIDIEARLPGRREQGLSLLSGGERSLTAVALIFSLLKVSPTPFCAMDEVDAMLDEANVGRFRDLLKELSETIQFIVITHNRNTVQAADVIYGVTMGRDSASQVISLRLDEVPDEMVRSS